MAPMTRRFLGGSMMLAAAVALWWGTPARVAAQGALAASNGEGAGTAVATPRTADGHPDLSGLWKIGAARATVVDAQGNINANGNRADASGANAEREGFLRSRMNPNRPVYKPEFWEKVQWLDDHEITEDSYFSCNPLGVPRQGPPAKIVQTPKEAIFLYEAPGAAGARNAFRVIPTDGRPHHP